MDQADVEDLGVLDFMVVVLHSILILADQFDFNRVRGGDKNGRLVSGFIVDLEVRVRF